MLESMPYRRSSDFQPNTPIPGIRFYTDQFFAHTAWALGNFVWIIVPGGPTGFNLGTMLVSAGWATWFYKIGIPRRIEQRQAWRKWRYELWLKKPVPELAEQMPWPEIERAMGEIVKASERPGSRWYGCEPTYERAEDWLRQEWQRKQREEARKHCKHENIEIIFTDQFTEQRNICTDCGANVPTSAELREEATRMELEGLREKIINMLRVPTHLHLPTMLRRATEYEVEVSPDGWHDCPECGHWHYAPHCGGKLCQCDPVRLADWLKKT